MVILSFKLVSNTTGFPTPGCMATRLSGYPTVCLSGCLARLGYWGIGRLGLATGLGRARPGTVRWVGLGLGTARLGRYSPCTHPGTPHPVHHPCTPPHPGVPHRPAEQCQGGHTHRSRGAGAADSGQKPPPGSVH